MDELEFVEHYCGKLEKKQMFMTKYAIENGFFYGVGRAIGRMVFWPLISKNGITFNVIDGAGYNQLPSLEGRIGFVVKKAQ